MIRLDYNKLVNSLKALLGQDALVGATLPGQVGNERRRSFQALMDEGDLINTDVLTDSVNITEAALKSVSSAEKFATLSGCAAPATDTCLENFVAAFAEKAYRRPLADDEKTRVLGLYRSIVASGSTKEEAARYALEGAMLAPQALYRSELGVVEGTAAKLSAHEVASALSYFLTDGPPDPALAAAARAGELGSSAGMRAQIDRLLPITQTRENLNQVVGAYFTLNQIDEAKKESSVFPEWNGAVTNSMYTETATFIRNTLWQGQLSGLLTSRTTYVNSVLATLYGVPYPGANGGDPTSTFVPVEFPAGQRAGIMTQGSVMAMRARTNDTSVVSRGLYVNGRILCFKSPPGPPESVTGMVEEQTLDPTRTQRQKANDRAGIPICTACHRAIDPYGLTLENYDGIGRYRSSYPGNVAIDSSVTLPAEAGGVKVQNASELASVVAESGVFTRCITTNFMKYSRAEAQSNLSADACAVEQVHKAFSAGDRSFSSMVREVALALGTSSRLVGGP